MRVTFPLAGFLSPQADFSVGIPVAVANPASAEKGQAWKTVGGGRRCCSVILKRGNNFITQFFGNHFIRVNRQQPRLCGVRRCKIPPRRVAAPRLAENFRSEERRVGKECRSRW